MDTPETEGQPKPLPKEAERRHVEDADARGLPVRLSGGETWFIAPLCLNPRGQKIASALDAMPKLETASVAAQKRCDLAQQAIDAAADEAAIEAGAARLDAATDALGKAENAVQALRSEIAYHALRGHYRVTREETDILVNQRHWADVAKALYGQDTREAEHARALEMLRALRRESGERADVPFPSPRTSDGPAPS